MFTETDLRNNPALIKAFMGLPADAFWQIIDELEAKMPAYRTGQLDRPDRQRAVGGGRKFDLSLTIRTALVLSYLRLHTSQQVIALLYGATQSDVSRELRRLLPLIETVLPSPEIWQTIEQGTPLSSEEIYSLEMFSEERLLIDATEQPVLRKQDPEARKAYYSGKKKQFTLKTQLLTDDEHHIIALSVSVPGSKHDKRLSDEVATVERLPDGCEAIGDKGYQGLQGQVSFVSIEDEGEKVPRLTVTTPIKKPKGGSLTEEQRLFNQALSRIRIRIEHCIGWVKNWAIVATRFRCDHGIYTSVMRVVSGLVNLQTLRWQAAQGHLIE